MERSVCDIVNLYNPNDPLEEAWTIPAPWYFDTRIAELERASVFSAAWQVVGRMDQVRDNGEFFTAELAGEPLVVVRGDDGQLRAFYNVCRHHAAAVVPDFRAARNISLPLPRLDLRNRWRAERHGRV